MIYLTTDPDNLAAQLLMTVLGEKAISLDRPFISAEKFGLVILEPGEALTPQHQEVISTFLSADKRIGFLTGRDIESLRRNLIKTRTDIVKAVGSIGMPDFVSCEKKREWDIFVLSGHANGLDAAGGPGEILCAREGSESVGFSPNTPSRTFPCFYRQPCFRQSNDTAGQQNRLLSPESIRARVVVATGCNTTTLFGSPFDHRLQLIERLRSGYSLAVIAATTLTPSGIACGALAAGLIAEGLALGDVTFELNKAVAELFGKRSFSPTSMSPFVLFGNPNLRFVGWPLHSGIFPPDDFIERISVPIECAQQPIGVARISRPRTRMRAPYLLSNTSGKVFDAVGIWRTTPTDEVIHILYRRKGVPQIEQKTVSESTLQIELCPNLPLGSSIAMIDRFCGEVSQWPALFAQYDPNVLDVPAHDGHEKFLFATITRTISRIGALRNQFAMQCGVLDTTIASRVEAKYEIAIKLIFKLSEILCEVAAMLASTIGSSFFLGWGASYRWNSELTGPYRCSCGRADVAGRQATSQWIATGHARATYECPACGPVGEDDGRYYLLQVDSCAAQCYRGERLLLALLISAPEEESISLTVTLILESWYKENGALAHELKSRIIMCGNKLNENVGIDVPSGFPIGLHVASVVAVINGALFVRRRYIDVQDRKANNERIFKDQGVGSCQDRIDPAPPTPSLSS